MFKYEPNKSIHLLNQYGKFVFKKEYKSKTDALVDCFTHFQEITTRDLVIAPFYYNCGYSVMRNLKKFRNIDFKKQDLIKEGKKVCEKYVLINETPLVDEKGQTQLFEVSQFYEGY